MGGPVMSTPKKKKKLPLKPNEEAESVPDDSPAVKPNIPGKDKKKEKTWVDDVRWFG